MEENILNDTLTVWLDALDQYSWPQLLAKPTPGSWSIGQVYMHLIADTKFYMDQIRACLHSDDHADQSCTAFASAILTNNQFPDEQIVGSPDNAFLPQPVSPEELRSDFIQLIQELKELCIAVNNSPHKGKSLHPGFNYLNAEEWLQLTDMHFRHHLRQKAGIDRFLQDPSTIDSGYSNK